MANIGNLVTTLVADASNYKSGMQTGVRANEVFSGSLDNIVGKLSRTKQQLQQGNLTTRDHILKASLKGATEGEINRALQLHDETEALRAQKKAEDDATAAKLRSRETGESLIRTLEHQKATLGMTSAELQLYRAQQLGASQADLDRARALQVEIKRLQQTAEAHESLTSKSRLTSSGLGGLSRNSMILTETTRGLEDAVAGFSNNGLKGMLQATTNNIGQIGALAGGMTGMALSVGSVAALIGVSLVPKLYEWANATEQVSMAQEKLTKASEKAAERSIELMQKQLEHRNALRNDHLDFKQDLKGLAEPDAIQQELEQRRQLHRERNQDIELLEKELKLQKMGDKRVAEPVVIWERPNAKRNWEDWNNGVMSDDEFDKLVEREEKLNERRRKFQDGQREVDRLNQKGLTNFKQVEKLEDRLKDAKEKQANEEKLKALQEFQQKDAAMRQKHWDEIARAEDNARNKLGGLLEGEIAKRSPLMGDELARKREELEIQNAINDAINQGVITKREGVIAENFFKDKPGAGPGGSAAAVQSGTTAEYSTLVKAFNQSRQDDYAKKQYDEVKKYLPLLDNINQKDVIQVIVKN